ncbi:MAG: AAA family ATPase [Desulfarculaceae bacterium]|nr:AAA family ATPase [Desulfarculaceae bacterium]
MNHRPFGLQLDPFGPEPDPRFVVLTPPHREALATLVYALDQREGWALLHGSAGLGKTTILQALMLQLGPEVISAVVSRPYLKVLPLCNQIALALGLGGPYDSKGPFLDDFRSRLDTMRAQGQSLLLVIDDAQMLPPDLLTEVRLLGNEDQGSPRVLNLFLSARPLIQVQMERGHELALRQLLRRQPKLLPLDAAEAMNYVAKRLSIAGGDPDLFQPDALRLIHQEAHGVPRAINRLCGLCLSAAAEAGAAPIGPDTARAVLEKAPRLEAAPGQGWLAPNETAPPPQPMPLDQDGFPTPEHPWDACAHPHPRPEPTPEEQALENRLMNRCANLYRGQSWWEKTTAFTVEWDNLRRRRLGLLGPAFPSFCPRWVDARWGSLNLGRRAADYEGAIYTDWIAAQYRRVLGESLGELPLSELSSPAAVAYWREEAAGQEPAPPAPVAAPFDGWDDFDPERPEHAAHAGKAVDELFDLASYVCADERKTAEDLVTEAVCQAVLPLKALRGLPAVQKFVSQSLSRRADAAPAQASEPPPGEHPPLII